MVVFANRVEGGEVRFFDKRKRKGDKAGVLLIVAEDERGPFVVDVTSATAQLERLYLELTQLKNFYPQFAFLFDEKVNVNKARDIVWEEVNKIYTKIKIN